MNYLTQEYLENSFYFGNLLLNLTQLAATLVFIILIFRKRKEFNQKQEQMHKEAANEQENNLNDYDLIDRFFDFVKIHLFKAYQYFKSK